jgi:BirA family biotin operon repressor/biotin-[acetyl-CoA-carboxylase] ligase
MSVLLRHPRRLSMWNSTALASVALADAIQDLWPVLVPAIKWPNDVLLADHKVAGILAESTWTGDAAVVALGRGVNVRSTLDDLENVGQPATSLAISVGAPVGRGELLRRFVTRMDDWLARDEADVRAAWHARLWRRDQRVRLVESDAAVEVVVVGADRDGGLLVRLADGSERTISSGDLLL